MFNTYGRSPDAVGTLLQAFASILYNQEINSITMAFKTWMKTSSVMPTPADIIGLIEGEKTETDQFQDWEFQEIPKGSQIGMHVYSFQGKDWIKVPRKKKRSQE